MVKLLLPKHRGGLRRSPRQRKQERRQSTSVKSRVGNTQKYARILVYAILVVLVLQQNIDEFVQYSDLNHYMDVAASMQSPDNETLSDKITTSPMAHKQPISPQTDMLVKKGPVVLNQCLVQANNYHIQSRLMEQKDNSIPLMASFIPSPNRVEYEARKNKNYDLRKIQESPAPHYWTATFSLCHIMWKRKSRQRKRIPQVSDSGNWNCDGQPAKVIADGCPSGSTVVVQCPQTQDTLVSNVTWTNYTYFVEDHAKCEQSNPLRTSPESLPNAKVVASLITYKMSTTILLEWLEYHRLVVGVDHFFVYVLQDNVENLPNMKYITYIPFDLNPTVKSLNDRFLFQTAAQTDTLHRARRHGNIEWIMYNDVDEYFDILKKRAGVNEKSDERMTLPEYLNGSDSEGRPIAQFDAVQVESASFGKNQAGGQRDLPFLLNYTTRMVKTWKKHRCKSIAKTTRIDYVNIHWVIGPEENRHYADPDDELLIHHYKSPFKGPFKFGLGSERRAIDARLADLYADPIQRRVWDILNRTGEYDHFF